MQHLNEYRKVQKRQTTVELQSMTDSVSYKGDQGDQYHQASNDTL